MPHKSKMNRGRKRRKRAFFRRSAFNAGGPRGQGGSNFLAPMFDMAGFIRTFSRRGRS